MAKTLFSFVVVSFCAMAVLGQDKYHKIEVAGGYSLMRLDGVVGDGDFFSDQAATAMTQVGQLQFGAPPDPTRFFPATPFFFTSERRHPRAHGFNASAVYNLTKHIGVAFEMSGNYRSNVVTPAGPIQLQLACTASPTCNAVTIQSPLFPQSYRGIIIYSLGADTQTKQSHYNFLGGLQIKNNSTEKKFKPFAHALAGVARQSVKLDFPDNGNTFDRANDASTIFGTNKITNTGLAMEFGGGIDIRLSRRLDLRVIQFDYNPVRINDQTILGFRQAITGINIANNFTFTNTADPNFTQYSPYDISIRSRWQNNFRIGVGLVFH